MKYPMLKLSAKTASEKKTFRLISLHDYVCIIINILMSASLF